MADQRCGPAQERDRRRLAAVALEGGVPDRRAYLHVAVDPRDAVETGDAVEVDEQFRPREPQREQGNQTLAPGEDRGVPAALFEQGDRAVDRVGRCVLERRQLHSGPHGWAIS